MSRRPYRVGRSRTGLGLFATEPIAKGSIIAYYRGQKITAEESERREARGNRYLYEINSKWVVDGSNRRNLARYANHSCRPNCESDTRGHTIFIRAIRNIQPGDEITYHYGKNYFDMFLKPIGCKCVKCIEKRREERAAKIAATKRRKAREARKAAEQAGSKGKTANGAHRASATAARSPSGRNGAAKSTTKATTKSAKAKRTKTKRAKSSSASARSSAARRARNGGGAAAST